MAEQLRPARRVIDVHVLHTIPYANLNRDDTNSVKTVQYGGANRTRVSSQSWKRAIRLRAQQTLGQAALRTRRLPERLEEHLVAAHEWPRELAARAGVYTVLAGSVGAEAPKKKADADAPRNAWATAAMVYVPDTAIEELAQIAIEHRTALEAAKDVDAAGMKKAKEAGVLPGDRIDAVLRSRNGIINLFGRMLAELDDAKVDGAAQVAHAFTTHRTDSEIDYFAAVDDTTDAWGDIAGSAHMGHAEHSAGTLYRYAVLDLDDLAHNLGGDLGAAAELATAFVDAVVLSMPAAKKNSTAPHTLPDLVHLAVRSDRPVSYAAAFEQPVTAQRGGGFVQPSITALNEYAAAVSRFLGTDTLGFRGYASLAAKDLGGLGERRDSVDELIRDAVADAVGGDKA
ncbi:type I-E CRISPR-associated protein Cas7/Cse4/CasC [Yinghuangia aomiensis]